MAVFEGHFDVGSRLGQKMNNTSAMERKKLTFKMPNTTADDLFQDSIMPRRNGHYDDGHSPTLAAEGCSYIEPVAASWCSR